MDTYNQLEQAKKFKQQITHNIAHELKTPLTGIRAYLETILNDKEMSLEQMTKFIEKAHKQTLRLSALVHNVSTLNKLDEESEYDFKIEDEDDLVIYEDLPDGVAIKGLELPNGSSITLTVAYYNPPCGVNYHGIGVTPDVIVEDTSKEVDLQLESAYSEMQKLLNDN